VLWVNRIVGVALIAATAVLWRISTEYPDTAPIFPQVMFAIVAVLSAVMIVRSFIPAIAPRVGGEGEQSVAVLGRSLAVFVVATLAILGITLIGFFPAMVMMAAVLAPIVGARHYGWYAFATVSLLVVIYIVFVIFLRVPLTLLPPGL
jgi:tripartite tricarboxylate transporter TctB family protein